jgi:hypothetical protein
LTVKDQVNEKNNMKPLIRVNIISGFLLKTQCPVPFIALTTVDIREKEAN